MIFKHYLNYLNQPFNFSGRSSRAAFWSVFLLNFFFSLLLNVLELELGSQDGRLSTTFSLILLLPSISLGIRRMHDIGLSGWCSIIPVVNIILAARKGNDFRNQYGDVPEV